MVTDSVIPVEKCKPHERNYNAHGAEQIKDLAESLRQFGQVRSIVVQAQKGGAFLLVAGHGIWLAAQKAGLKELRANVIPASWSKTKVLAYLAADNELSRRGSPDEEQLAAIVREVCAAEGESLAALAAGERAALDAILAIESGDADAPPEIDRADELQKKWQTERGQLWAIGPHRLLCGDSTDVGDVARVMGGKNYETLIYDPEWDNASKMELPAWCIAFTDGQRAADVINLFGAPAWVFVWDCVSSWYTPNRPLKRGKLAFFYGDITKYNFDGAHYGDAGKARDVVNTRGSYTFQPDPRGKHLSDVFSQPITKLHAESEHSHSKPGDWVKMLIGNCTAGDVFDPFAGSGTTLVACQNLGRVCRAIEISPAYCAVILERMITAFPTLDVHKLD